MHHKTKIKRVKLKKDGSIREVYSCGGNHTSLMIEETNPREGYIMFRQFPDEYEEIKKFNSRIKENTRADWVDENEYTIISSNDYNCKYNCPDCKKKCDFYEKEEEKEEV